MTGRPTLTGVVDLCAVEPVSWSPSAVVATCPGKRSNRGQKIPAGHPARAKS
ncbi:MAG: hypothetical protein SFX18_00635 [Pirellulales bacterium]|nr:hypothetical protein [Pirellulales bacterium]